ncbi:MAG TPA: sugar ABC transporter ATP-binding protein [Thermoanaerobaculia bacterium]|nr:sugar ABC transporter ATP-binding protein [Thermoanaerobaculia bacterium]
MALLELSGIEKRFGATAALSGVTLTIQPGEIRALVGENGAGKSTLVAILSGAFAPDAGRMRLAGEPYAPRDAADARRSGVACIHQELCLCPHLSVAENILLGIEPASGGWISRRRALARAAALLSEFGRGEIDPGRRVGSLALPDRQIVEICRALACDARLLLMDEPTSTLQRSNVDRLFRLMRQLRERGIAILYISHFLEEVREIAGTYTILRDGQSVDSGELASVGDGGLIAGMVGRQLQSTLARGTAPAAPGEPLLEVRDLASPPRLRSVSFELHRGEILGIAGLIGSGRTDLLRALFGLSPATGRLRWRGEDLPAAGLESSRQIRRGLGYLSEDRKAEGLALGLSIADNVTLSRFSTCARRGWIHLREQRKQTEDVLGLLRVRTPGVRSRVLRLSGGNQQKVALGRLLHQDPDLLLLDEPARGIDVGSKNDIYREIGRMAERGKAILMVSSYLPELLSLCHRIAVMSRGRLSPARPASEWTQDSILQAAIGS